MRKTLAMLIPMRRIRHFVIAFLLMLPMLIAPNASGAQGYPVNEWTSPTYGFSVSYRTDAFALQSEGSAAGIDLLVLESAVGWFSVEAMPAVMTIDECVQVILDDVYASEGNHELQLPVADGIGLIRSTFVDSSGYYSDHTVRVDCQMSDEGDYLVRFVHSVPTDQYGFYEIAARDIRASFRPGYPANNPLPANVTDPDGTLEVSAIALAPVPTSTADEQFALLTIAITVTSVSNTGALLETGRIIAVNAGSSVSHIWISNGTLFADDDIVVTAGTSITGHLTFAIPATMSDVTICYQHVSDANCTELVRYDLGTGANSVPDPLPRIDPGR